MRPDAERPRRAGTDRGRRRRGAPVWIGLAACGLLLGAPPGAAPQDTPQVRRIGVLDIAGEASSGANLAAFREGLRALGHVEGERLAIVYRSADAQAARLPDLAAELVRLRVDVIVTNGTAAALAARHVTDTVPIVMASSSDPVFAGLVTSLARPGGNVTGLHLPVPAAVAGKRLALLVEARPGLSRVGVLLDPGDVSALLMVKEVERAAQTMGIRLHRVEALRPGEFEGKFEAILLDRVEALVVLDGPVTAAAMPRIVDFAARSRLPAVSGPREFVDAGGLMAYGPDVPDLFRRAATYVHRILEGARPGDLPLEPPVKLALAINLRASRGLGLTLPPSLARRADYVVE